MAVSMPEKTLKTIFEEAIKNYSEIEEGNVSPNAQQALIQKTIQLLEESTKLVNIGEIFSDNEMLEEVQTESIQYLAIPAMLGLLVGKLQNNERLSILETEEIYLKDFLTRGQEYGIVPTNNKISKVGAPSGGIDLTRLVTNRNEKIMKYEEQKRLQADLVQLKGNLDRADDEVRRTYFTKFVKNFVFIVEEELRSIDMEKPLAEKMKREKESGVTKKRERGPPPAPLKPIIITRNQFEKKVFGAGYPSLPTMTVDEFYEDRVKQGIFPSGGSNYGTSMQQLEDPEYEKAKDEEEQVQKEVAEETDDAEALAKARNMDEFKDTHRRGWGNRNNRS